MEKYFTLPTPDGFEMNGVLNSKNKSEKLIIFVHGFTGSMNEAHFYCAKNFFIEKGFEVVRFNLYTDGDKTRKLHTASIKNHGNDIESVVRYFEDEYQEIVLVGHSLAGPSFLRISKICSKLKKIVFWDPAFDTSTSIGKIIHENDKIFRIGSGKIVQISPEMFQELSDNQHVSMLENFPFPRKDMFCIYAENDRHVLNKIKTDALGIPSYIITGATHGFKEEGKFEELFEKTFEFIRGEH